MLMWVSNCKDVYTCMPTSQYCWRNIVEQSWIEPATFEQPFDHDGQPFKHKPI